jgi:hypothetical protein
MANFNTNKYSGNYVQVVITEKSQSIANNETTLSYSIKALGGSSASYYLAGPIKVKINGVTVYNQTGRIPFYGTLKTGTLVVDHTSDGSKNIKVEISAAIYYFAVNCEYSGTMTLTKIPRYANITKFQLDNATRTINSFKVIWATDKNVDQVDYSLNGGSWKTAQTGNRKDSSFVISGLNPNTTYNLNIRVRASDSGLFTQGSRVHTITTYDYAKLTNAPSVNVGSVQNIIWTNPSGASLNLRLYNKNTGSEVQNIGAVTGTSKSITIDSTKIYPQMYYTTSENYFYRLTTTQNSVSYNSDLAFKFSIPNSPPTFSASQFTFQDTNSAMTAITGSNQILVKGKSNLQVKINSAMTTQKQALQSGYVVTMDSFNSNVTNLTYPISVDLGTPANAGSRTIYVKAIDSRGFNTTVNKSFTVIDYEKPKINAKAMRENGYENNTELEISGSYSKVVVNSANKNVVKSVRIRYKESTATSYGAWETLLLTTNTTNETYTAKYNISSNKVLVLDNKKAYNVQVEVTDNIETNTATINVPVGLPSFFIGDNVKTVGVGVVPPSNATDVAIYSSKYRGGTYDIATAVELLNRIKGEVLFSGTATFPTTVTLSNVATDFQHLRIYYYSNDSTRGSVDVSTGVGNAYLLPSGYPNTSSNYMYFKVGMCYLETATKIRWGSTTYPDQSPRQLGFAGTSGGTTTLSTKSDVNFTIYKVVGYSIT